MGVCWKCAAAVPLLIALVMFLAPLIQRELETANGYTAPEDSTKLPEEVMDQFRMYDTDGDGRLDPEEFFDLITQVRLLVQCSVWWCSYHYLLLCSCLCVLNLSNI